MSLMIYINNLFTGAVFFLFIVLIIAYKKWIRKPEVKENKKINASVEKTSSGIPKPTRKQELVGNNKSDVKNEERKWKLVSSLAMMPGYQHLQTSN